MLLIAELPLKIHILLAIPHNQTRIPLLLFSFAYIDIKGKIMDEISIEKIYNQAIELLMLYGPKFILAILVLIIGWWLIGRIANMAEKSMNKVKFEVGIKKLLV